jgi:hypothetical protein
MSTRPPFLLRQPGRRTQVVHTFSTGARVTTVLTGTDWASEERNTVQTGADSTIDASGWRPPKPYATTGYKLTYPSGHIIYQQNGTTEITQNGHLKGITAFPALSSTVSANVPAGLRSRAEVGALMKLKRQDFNLAQCFAERRKTAQLIESSLKRVNKDMEKWIRKWAKKARRHQQGWRDRTMLENAFHNVDAIIRSGVPGASNAWLELQYGWIPLVSDIQNSYNHLTRFPRPPMFHVTKVEKGVQRGLATASTNFLGGQIHWRNDWEESYLVKVRFDCILASDELSELSSLGLLNPLSLAYELLPYSFVLDWFIPLGKYLSSLDASAPYTLKGGSISLKSERKSKVTCTGTTSGATLFQKSRAGGQGQARDYKFTREIYTSFPFPPPPAFTNLEDIKNAVSRGVTAIALMVQLLHGGQTSYR